MKKITIEQMELGMNNLRPALQNARHHRLKRARWWFGRMRQVVDLALPSQPMVSPRPEQTYLKIAQPTFRNGN